MASWPVSLPGLNVDGYLEQREDGTLRTQMDAGPDFVRLRFSAVSIPISNSLVLTDTQVATLDAFYATTLNGGADAFDWTHPRTGASVSFEFRAAPAIRAHSDDLFQVDLSLAILP